MRTSEFSLRKFNKYTFIFVISLLFKTNLKNFIIFRNNFIPFNTTSCFGNNFEKYFYIFLIFTP